MQLLLVCGPTAVGKTDFVNQLSLHAPVEIINMDMGQMYKPISIGTAKPDWKNAQVPHHLFDIIQSPENYTAAFYRQIVLQKIVEIQKRGALPVLVGGSSFYLKSVLFPLEEQIVETPVSFVDKETSFLWHELKKIDPVRANAIHPHDRYRIERALSIWYTTGKKPSLCDVVYNPPCN